MYTVSEFNLLKDLDLTNKRILLRVDLNVPLHGTQIKDDFRLRAIIPTLDYILNKNGTIILATHIGRPKSNEPSLSTQLLIPWFEQRGYSITFVEDPQKLSAKKISESKTLILLENLRFFPGEKSDDTVFAQELANCADLYINDAFAVLHRDDTSITGVPKLFAPNKRAIGFLIEQELIHLNKLITQSKKPFVLVLGGGKVHDKLPLIESLLDCATAILLCPALVFTFLSANGKSVGNSLVDHTALEKARMLMDQARKKNVELVFPVDYQIAMANINGPLSIVDADNFPAEGIGTSTGPKTTTLFTTYLAQAGTIFYNAGMGFDHRPETHDGGKELLQAIAQSSAYSVIGGGSSVALAHAAHVTDKLSFISSGGGATLTYLANKPLPGLEMLMNRAEP